MISIGKILFFILMPLIYKGIQIFILKDDRHMKGFYRTHLISLIWYYAIEVFFILSFYKVTNELIFANNTIDTEAGCFPMFVICSCAFVIIHLILLFLALDEMETSLIHCIVLTVLFIFFEPMTLSVATDEMNTKVFESMPYEVTSTEVIQLEAFSDTHTTSGELHGSRYYINGNIHDNYEIYYCFLDEKGSLTIRHFTYYEDHCDIYPEENCENPTLKITTLSKSYKDKSSTIYEYEIHIPKNSIGNSAIDMQ